MGNVAANVRMRCIDEEVLRQSLPAHTLQACCCSSNSPDETNVSEMRHLDPMDPDPLPFHDFCLKHFAQNTSVGKKYLKKKERKSKDPNAAAEEKPKKARTKVVKKKPPPTEEADSDSSSYKEPIATKGTEPDDVHGALIFGGMAAVASRRYSGVRDGDFSDDEASPRASQAGGKQDSPGASGTSTAVPSTTDKDSNHAKDDFGDIEINPNAPKYTYEDGSTYIGQVINGKRQGEGCWKYETGMYTGQWNEDLQHGQGKLVWSDGRIYEGQFMKGRFAGYGCMVWTGEEGQIKYEGEYKEGLKHGSGKLTWPNGRNYDGEWKRGKRHGRGAYTNSQMQKRVGYWVADKISTVQY